MRENILKAGIRGRLVANDFSGALISAIVLEQDATGRPIDPIEVAHELESRVRDKIQDNDVLVQAQGGGVDVHMIGFAKVVGDIADGAMSVIVFAVVTILLTLLAVWYYVQSLKVAVVPIVCSIIAVIWQLGTLVLLGYGIDPLGLLVPFLIFAIGVSHGVQKISAVKEAAVAGSSSMDAAQQTFRQLLMPAIIALLADLVGFITILLIPVQVVQEMAITASIGVAIVILTDLVLLPVLVSWVKWDDAYRLACRSQTGKAGTPVASAGADHRARPGAGDHRRRGVAGRLRRLEGTRDAHRRYAGWRARAAPDSRYNHDSNIITSQILHRRRHPERDRRDEGAGLHQPRAHDGHRQLLLEDAQRRRRAGGDVAAHRRQDRDCRMERRQPQVAQHSARAQPAHAIDALHRDQHRPAQRRLQRRAGHDFPARPQGGDHRARGRRGEGSGARANPIKGATFNLATGNVGVMAATNEEVKAKEYPILGWVFAAVILMCLLTFRSLLGTVLVFLPLALVSILVYAVMAIVGIGLKVNTLPMVALGAGIGVDYGIYLWSRMQEYLEAGDSVHDAYFKTMRVTGASIIFTGITLAIGVVTWVFSPLQFQADIGIMLTFMFFVNMLGAIILLPALAAWFVRPTAPARAV